jgi:hypothetical protein
MGEANEMEEGVIWPGLLIRIRPAARPAFGVVLAIDILRLMFASR